MAAQRSNSGRTRGSPRNAGDEQTFSEPRPDGPAEDREARLVGEDPDVVLDVPTLNIDELDLEVEDLQAHVSVRAELAGFVNINIGVDARLDKVKLGIKGIEAQVLLKVKLERILGTIDSALRALEQNPELLLDSRSRESDRELAQIEGSVASPAGTDDEPEGQSANVEATTAARRKAEDLGVDLAQVEGTGAGGRILVRDVLQAAR